MEDKAWQRMAASTSQQITLSNLMNGLHLKAVRLWEGGGQLLRSDNLIMTDTIIIVSRHQEITVWDMTM